MIYAKTSGHLAISFLDCTIADKNSSFILFVSLVGIWRQSVPPNEIQTGFSFFGICVCRFWGRIRQLFGLMLDHWSASSICTNYKQSCLLPPFPQVLVQGQVQGQSSKVKFKVKFNFFLFFPKIFSEKIFSENLFPKN